MIIPCITANTIQVMRINKQSRHRVCAFFLLFFSITLITVALPRFRASINHIPVDIAIHELINNKTLTMERLDTLIATSKASIDIWNNNLYWNDLHVLLTHKGRLVGFFSQQGQTLLLQAQQAIQQSLSRSPTNSYLWYKLAWLKALQQNNISHHTSSYIDDIVQALRLSILQGPNELHFIVARLELCFFYFKHFKQTDYEILRSQTLLVRKNGRHLFTRMLKKYPHFFKPIAKLVQETDPNFMDKLK